MLYRAFVFCNKLLANLCTWQCWLFVSCWLYGKLIISYLIRDVWWRQAVWWSVTNLLENCQTSSGQSFQIKLKQRRILTLCWMSLTGLVMTCKQGQQKCLYPLSIANVGPCNMKWKIWSKLYKISETKFALFPLKL